tara:strand:- start:14166 stop:14369 length:204 start_codon:yes stop_codon:yes gene_type:complete
MYRSDRQNSISGVFPGLTCFHHFGDRANLATGFLIAYTDRIGIEVLQRFNTPDKTHFDNLKILLVPA